MLDRIILEGISSEAVSSNSSNQTTSINVDGIPLVTLQNIPAVNIHEDNQSNATVIKAFNQPPELKQNELVLGNGDTVQVGINQLIIEDVDSKDSHLKYSIKTISGGEFIKRSNNQVITEFTQEDLLTEDILFQHAGNGIAPNYTIQVEDEETVLSPSLANITFSSQPHLSLVNNALVLDGTGTLTLNRSHLFAIADGEPNPIIFYEMTGLSNGVFFYKPNGSEATITNQLFDFNIDHEEIVLQYNISGPLPAYNVTAYFGNYLVRNQTANVTRLNNDDGDGDSNNPNDTNDHSANDGFFSSTKNIGLAAGAGAVLIAAGLFAKRHCTKIRNGTAHVQEGQSSSAVVANNI